MGYFKNQINTSGKEDVSDSIAQDNEFEAMWKRGAVSRKAKKEANFYTETLPKELRQLERLANIFGKIKLNERDLPFS